MWFLVWVLGCYPGDPAEEGHNVPLRQIGVERLASGEKNVAVGLWFHSRLMKNLITTKIRTMGAINVRKALAMATDHTKSVPIVSIRLFIVLKEESNKTGTNGAEDEDGQ